MRSRVRLSWIACALLLAVSSVPLPLSASTDPDFQLNWRPTLEVHRIDIPIKIDGDLDDPGWKQAARATNFSEFFPNSQGKPPVQTEGLLAYDDDNLYVAIIAYDDDPGSIRSSLRDRDEFWSDDYVGFIFDTYGDASMAYEVFSNPMGIQGDGIQTLHGEDISFDIIFDSAGKMTDKGYQVEMAIPFSSLRFPNREEQVWRVNFWRTHPRDSRRTYSWAAIDEDDPCWMCQLGTLTGIRGVKPGGKIEILPSVVGSQASWLRDYDDPGAGLEHGRTDGEISVGARYSITSSIAAEATYNPDFSQVESDAAQIDVNSTFALFYPERRPFFQEGSDLFDTWHTVFYTRSINDPLVAARITGQMNRTNFAYLVAYDEHSPVIIPFQERSEVISSLGGSTSNVLRLRQTFFENSYAGIMATDRRLDNGGANTVIGADGYIRFLKSYRFEWQVLQSHTEEPDDTALTTDINDLLFDNDKHTAAFDGEFYRGHALYTGFKRLSRNWNLALGYWETSPTFRADNGFIFRNDTRMATSWTGYTFYFEDRFIDRFEPGLAVGRVWNFNGARKDEWINPYLWFMLKGQTGIRAAYLYTRENYEGVQLGRMDRFQLNVNSNFSEVLSCGMWMDAGPKVARNEDPPVLGDGVDLGVWATIKPMTRFIVQPNLSFSRLTRQDSGERLFNGYILRTRFNYQFNRELMLRLVLQYNDFGKLFDVEPLLSYTVNPFTIFYIGSTHSYADLETSSGYTQESRQFFLKFQYLIRL